MGNPFTLMYGKASASIVSRQEQSERIIAEFTSDNAQGLSYLITGIRGSGKTVLLREIAKKLEKEGWIVIDINPQSNIIRSFSERLYGVGKVKKLFSDWSLTIGGPYMSLTLKNGNNATEPDIIAEKLVEQAEKQGKRILITIDEAAPTQDMRFFANFYQSMIGRDHQLYLLMTGLRENLDALVSDKAISFLSRTPKIDLQPLEIAKITKNYKKDLGVSDEESIRLAKLTQGYAFAYQVLGYFYYESGKKKIDESLISEYELYLWQNGYDVIWRGLTQRDRDFCYAIAACPTSQVSEIQKMSKMGQSNFQNYRRKLIQNGYLKADGYGTLSFTLPRFKEYVLFQRELDE